MSRRLRATPWFRSEEAEAKARKDREVRLMLRDLDRGYYQDFFWKGHRAWLLGGGGFEIGIDLGPKSIKDPKLAQHMHTCQEVPSKYWLSKTHTWLHAGRNCHRPHVAQCPSHQKHEPATKVPEPHFHECYYRSYWSGEAFRVPNHKWAHRDETCPNRSIGVTSMLCYEHGPQCKLHPGTRLVQGKCPTCSEMYANRVFMNWVDPPGKIIRLDQDESQGDPPSGFGCMPRRKIFDEASSVDWDKVFRDQALKQLNAEIEGASPLYQFLKKGKDKEMSIPQTFSKEAEVTMACGCVFTTIIMGDYDGKNAPDVRRVDPLYGPTRKCWQHDRDRVVRERKERMERALSHLRRQGYDAQGSYDGSIIRAKGIEPGKLMHATMASYGYQKHVTGAWSDNDVKYTYWEYVA